MDRCIGVCSWSLSRTSVEDLVRQVRAVGVSAVQLALDPLRTGAWPTRETAATLGEASIAIRSGMMAMYGEDYSTLESIRDTGGVRSNEHWEANLVAAEDNARIAASLGIDLVTFHAGFIPHSRDDALRAVMVDRLRQIVDRFAACGVRVALETGQETAATLLDALETLDRPQVGVNFDPANMILYGMGDPVEALRQLAPRVAQIHIKDAVASAKPGKWGTEVVVGQGDVDFKALAEVIGDVGLTCDLMIERQASDSSIEDIQRARVHVGRLIGAGGSGGR